MSLVRPADGPVVVDVTPESAGWDWTGLRVLRLAPGVPTRVETGGSELFVLPLAGSLDVAVGADEHHLDGRESVFSRITDFLYVGRDTSFELRSADGAEVALPASRCEVALPPAYGAAEDVPVEIRGAGPATRQVANFGIPGAWDHADKLVCCELLTPEGNWSSYPPHKHDASEPCRVVNEEIYYYRIRSGPDGSSGFGYHTTYTGPEHEAAGLAPIDEDHRVRDHDVVLVPHGYHGPCVAAPGYEMYYLNVMAGPAGRELAFCDDPAHGWVRDTWAGMATDPRCPMTSAAGRREPS
jgi:5-deoxy-glucuronate isomerase